MSELFSLVLLRLCTSLCQMYRIPTCYLSRHYGLEGTPSLLSSPAQERWRRAVTGRYGGGGCWPLIGGESGYAAAIGRAARPAHPQLSSAEQHLRYVYLSVSVHVLVGCRLQHEGTQGTWSCTILYVYQQFYIHIKTVFINNVIVK